MDRYRDISDFAAAFAAEYKGYMKSHGVTNLQVAEVLGRNNGYVSERANGKRPLDTDDVDALASLIPGMTGVELMILLSQRANDRMRTGGAVIVGAFGQDADIEEIPENVEDEWEGEYAAYPKGDEPIDHGAP